jgi:hypothetical protein
MVQSRVSDVQVNFKMKFRTDSANGDISGVECARINVFSIYADGKFLVCTLLYTLNILDFTSNCQLQQRGMQYAL